MTLKLARSAKHSKTHENSKHTPLDTAWQQWVGGKHGPVTDWTHQVPRVSLFLLSSSLSLSLFLFLSLNVSISSLSSLSAASCKHVNLFFSFCCHEAFSCRLLDYACLDCLFFQYLVASLLGPLAAGFV